MRTRTGTDWPIGCALGRGRGDADLATALVADPAGVGFGRAEDVLGRTGTCLGDGVVGDATFGDMAVGDVAVGDGVVNPPLATPATAGP